MKETTVPMRQETWVPETRDEARTVVPPVDIFEIPDGLAVVADLPGVTKDSVEIQVQDDLLTIYGRVTPTTPTETSLYREYELMDYYRQFQLNERVDQDKIKAEMRHGVLTIHLPRTEKAKPKRIAVDVTA